MRGRRAFVILTIYLVLLAGFAWMVELIIERSSSSALRRLGGVRLGRDRAGHLRGLLMLETLQVVVPRARLDRRRDQPRAREADARPARRHADLVARHRHRQAVQRARLRLAADRRVDPAHRLRVRLRRRRSRRRPPRLPRPDRRPRSASGPSGCSGSSLVKRTQAATAISVFAVLFADHRHAVRARLLAGHGHVATTATRRRADQGAAAGRRSPT